MQSYWLAYLGALELSILRPDALCVKQYQAYIQCLNYNCADTSHIRQYLFAEFPACLNMSGYQLDGSNNKDILFQETVIHHDTFLS